MTEGTAPTNVPPDDLPDWWWDDYDDEDNDNDASDYCPCVICSCLIGDEVALGESNYFGDGRPICASCLGEEEDEA